jgi:hypothetical protein
MQRPSAFVRIDLHHTPPAAVCSRAFFTGFFVVLDESVRTSKAASQWSVASSRFSVGVHQLAELGHGGFQACDHELSVLEDAGCLIV